jgi:hypothetical protein
MSPSSFLTINFSNRTYLLTEITNKMQQCIKIYYSMFIWSSTCFGWHTAYHQETKTALAASGFAYMKGCWTLRLLDAYSIQQPFTYAKPEAASAVLGSWWWVVCRPNTLSFIITWNNKFWYTVASCWLFLYELYNDTQIHEHQEHTFPLQYSFTWSAVSFAPSTSRMHAHTSSPIRASGTPITCPTAVPQLQYSVASFP